MIGRVLVVDDEPLAREHLVELVREAAPRAEVFEARDGDAAVAAVRARKPDVVFLDVQMPGRDGFEVIRAVGPAKMPLTVFVTAFDKHAIRAFEVAAVDYLLKPFDGDRFRTTWARVATAHGLHAVAAESQRLVALLADMAGMNGAPARAETQAAHWADRVVVTKDQRTVIVKLSDVEWFEAAGNYVVVHSGKAEHRMRERLTALEARLDPRHFVRIHRSFIVAIDAIKELQPWFGGDQVLILKDGRQLRVSRTFRQRVAHSIAGTA